jgi:hypothetical protein
MHLESAGDLPDTDDAIRVSTEEGGTVGRPCKGNALRVLGLLARVEEFRTDFIDKSLGLKVPDLDARAGGSAQPVAVRREGKSVDEITSFKGVEVLGFVQIPEHDNTILATGRAERAIGRNGD